jgi:two-component system sensor histidine kinase BaeS
LRSLRSRLFLAITFAVVVSVAVSLVVAALLVRRSLEHQSLVALGRQADVLVAREAAAPRPSIAKLGVFFSTPEERVTILSLQQAALLLPPAGGRALAAGNPAEGEVTVNGTRFLYAARPLRGEAVILLRDSKLARSDWSPFGVAVLVAGLVAAGLAAITAFLLARALARPIRRVADASLSLAAGEHPGRIPEEGSEEVSALASAFNHMAEQLARAREAERSFLLSVSHELKTPLTAIRGYSEALLEHVIRPDEAGEVIGREAGRLERLVYDLLDLARLNQRVFSVTRQPVDLGEIARETVQRYEPQARDYGVTLALGPVEDAAAVGDPDRLHQVISNLVENALRCTPAGGSVAVGAAGSALSVEDTGPGIERKDLPRAFERFFLHDRYGGERQVGTGLGLAVVKELTEAMGGTVEVASEPGRGTRFTIRLPADSVQAERLGEGALPSADR